MRARLFGSAVVGTLLIAYGWLTARADDPTVGGGASGTFRARLSIEVEVKVEVDPEPGSESAAAPAPAPPASGRRAPAPEAPAETGRDPSGDAASSAPAPAAPPDGQGTPAQPAPRPATPAADADPNRYALLIGCTEYPGLRIGRENHDLTGPINDVNLLEQLLVNQYKFLPQNIVKLTEAEDESHKPTREYIQREFEALPEKVAGGGTPRVFIAFSGHGAQQPDQGGDETDGLDEILLPRDAGRAEDEAAPVLNAIVDDEIGRWLKAITDRSETATVTIVIDSCSSGTATRNFERARTVPMSALGYSEAAVKAAREKAAQKFGGARGDGDGKARGSWTDAVTGEEQEQPRLAAIYAAMPNEQEPEKSLPPFSEPFTGARLVYGQLTFVLNRLLLTAESPLSPRDLADRARDQYQAWWNAREPVPFSEGSDQDKAFLGDATLQRSPYRLDKDRDALTVNVGILHSVYDGTVFAVYPPPGRGDAQTPLGYVRVPDGGSELLESRVEPAEHDGRSPVPAGDLPQGGECQIVRRVFPAPALRVAVLPADPAAGADAAVAREIERLKGILKDLQGGENGAVELVEEDLRTNRGNSSDWLLLVGPQATTLVPTRSLVSAAEAERHAFRFEGIPRDESAARWLDIIFTYIGRARGLLYVAEPLGREPDNEFEVEMLLYPQQSGASRPGRNIGGGSTPADKPVPFDLNQNIQLYNGDRIGFRFNNTGRDAVDVSVLLVRNTYGISPVFPIGSSTRKFDNRIDPNSRPYSTAPIRYNVAAGDRGLDQFVVLAVRNQPGDPKDFRRFRQDGLNSQEFRDLLRGMGNFTRDIPIGTAEETPLGRLLKQVSIAGQRGDVEPETIGNVRARIIGAEFSEGPRPQQP